MLFSWTRICLLSNPFCWRRSWLNLIAGSKKWFFCSHHVCCNCWESISAGLGTQIESSQTCLRLCSLISVQCPHHFWRKVVTMVTPHAFASDHSNHYSRSSWKLQNHAAGAMEDATFFHCNNAIEDPILWVKGSTCCDGVAAFWPTMRLLCCLAMLSASSISKWNTVWSSMQWIQWRSGRFKVFAALMKPATVSWMHWLTCFEGRRFTFARQHVNVSWGLGLMHPCLAVPVEREAEGHEARPS